MALDKETVARIARLARIRLDEAERDPLAGELSRIVDWFEQLSEVDTEGVAPMTGASGMRLPMRDDVVTEHDSREAILGNAPRSAPDGPRKGFFAVPKVVE